MSPVETYSCENIDNDQKIWRFRNYNRFEEIIRKSSLYFCSTKKLVENDAHEGRYSKQIINDALKKSREQKYKTDISKSTKYPIPPNNRMDYFKHCYEPLDYTYSNCWHINSVEYEFMWKLYADKDRGIAIQTTFSKLIDSLNFNDFDIYIAPMDYEPELKYRYLWEPILNKRVHFKPEQELRIWTCGCEKEDGFRVEVNLDILIDKIYVKPKTSDEDKEKVRKLLCNYQLKDKPVLNSAIDDEPYEYLDL